MEVRVMRVEVRGWGGGSSASEDWGGSWQTPSDVIPVAITFLWR